jgi:L-lysine 2,3-aminomutase
LANTSDKVKEALGQIKEQAIKDQRFRQSIIPMKSASLFRTHKTRVEFDLDAPEQEISENIAYIKNDEDITDIVFSSINDASDLLYKLEKIFRRLEDVHHVTAYRLRSLNFNYEPHSYTRSKINKLGTLNKPSIVNPKRLEIETQFLHSTEISDEHGVLATQLRNKGITVYNNTPLLTFINDSMEEIKNLAYKCRENGIEFHHLYIAGLPIQEGWADEYPADVNNIIDIATYIRRHESGREVPRFIIRTVLGEVDFGLTSAISGTDDRGRLSISIKPYDIKYFRSMYPDYTWPDDLKFDDKNMPVVMVSGLKKTAKFLID